MLPGRADKPDDAATVAEVPPRCFLAAPATLACPHCGDSALAPLRAEAWDPSPREAGFRIVFACPRCKPGADVPAAALLIVQRRWRVELAWDVTA